MDFFERVKNFQSVFKADQLIKIGKKENKKSNAPFNIECNYSEGKKKIKDITYASCYISSEIIGSMQIILKFQKQKNKKTIIDTIKYTYNCTYSDINGKKSKEYFHENGTFNKYAKLFIEVYNSYK